jgi:hypothetical protein
MRKGTFIVFAFDTAIQGLSLAVMSVKRKAAVGFLRPNLVTWAVALKNHAAS